jgi:hypothetical protein
VAIFLAGREERAGQEEKAAMSQSADGKGGKGEGKQRGRRVCGCSCRALVCEVLHDSGPARAWVQDEASEAERVALCGER